MGDEARIETGEARDGREQREASRHPLRTFLVLDQVACVLAVAALVVVGVVQDEGYLLVIAVAVAATAGGLGLARRLLETEGESAAVWAMAVANWIVSIVASGIAVFAMPLLILSALAPAVVAAAYVSSRQLRHIVMLSMTVCMACAAVGSLQDFSGLSGRLPDAVRDGVLITFMPFVAALILVTALHSHRRLADTLDEALTTNVRLRASERQLEQQAAELTASRARLVTATDAERRRLERDLHDGAQQRFVALAVRLRLASRLVHRDPDKCEVLLEELVGQAQTGVAELRNLAHGVFPPVLSENGLVAALEDVAREMPLSCKVVAEHPRRLPAAIEAAVYFACLEALQNAMKHAGDRASVSVRLQFPADIRDDPANGGSGTGVQPFRFEIADDGAGFDEADIDRGAGLDNISDRIGAVGGTVVLSSQPGWGTVVRGTVPLSRGVG